MPSLTDARELDALLCRRDPLCYHAPHEGPCWKVPLFDAVDVEHVGGTRKSVRVLGISYGCADLEFGIAGAYRFIIHPRKGLVAGQGFAKSVRQWQLTIPSLDYLRAVEARQFDARRFMLGRLASGEAT
jgi:hypothetical protein